MAKPRSSEITPGPGFRIRTRISRPEPEIVAALAQFKTPDLCDLTNRLYAMAPGIRNLVNEEPIAGPACTVKLYPGDNLMLHKSLDVARPGDVVVVDTCGGRTNAVIGDLVAAKARHRGIAGFVVDGLMRDLEECKVVGLPIYARGTTPAGPLHRGPGELNYPICCGGVVVSPGDIVIADSMGITVVAQESAEDLLRQLRDNSERLARYTEQVRQGVFSMTWVDDELARGGCSIEE